ncbi:hypothetical protein CROQUDRAFT_658265 [Cronartium quercuum f. sp. fusiforme G11]|uniref:Uncharacterized protein n=1 Tax=Cronartium quercuum f. sp. fusiforme G11 TaxID=708437 RepID=A0A9P6NKL2_9BASI|nr:hypothetical protein CROQUDRAFT_658265 [Cronartium quercuum f. sp. fusiforme G11]
MQLRSNHIHLNQYLNKSQQLSDPSYDCQEGIETIKHYLFICIKYDNQRLQLLDQLQRRQIKPNEAILQNPTAFLFIAQYCNTTCRLKNHWTWAKINDKKARSLPLTHIL